MRTLTTAERQRFSPDVTGAAKLIRREAIACDEGCGCRAETTMHSAGPMDAICYGCVPAYLARATKVAHEASHAWAGAA